MKALSLYIHIPFCISKCGYCDFNSYALDTLLQEGRLGPDWAPRYADALVREMEARWRSLDLEGRPLESLFFGGGTPSLFPPEETGRVLAAARDLFSVRPGTEITLEANPGASDASCFAALRRAGVNRLSIGVQSFHDDALRRLGRIHTAEEARAAFRAAAARLGVSGRAVGVVNGYNYSAGDEVSLTVYAPPPRNGTGNGASQDDADGAS